MSLCLLRKDDQNQPLTIADYPTVFISPAHVGQEQKQTISHIN